MAGTDWLQGGGEMGGLMRAKDWSATPLGQPEGWPQSLRTALSIMLNSRYPMFVWWGKGLVNFYNDAYIPVLGNRHPAALGRAAREMWSEIWDVVGPEADTVMTEGRATWNDRQLLVMERYGYTEETYFSWSYSPVIDESGAVNGVFCACTEDTGRVLGERRLRTLSELGSRTEEVRDAHAACRKAAEAIARNPTDLPFAAIYLLEEASAARRAGGARIEEYQDLFPELLRADSPPWWLGRVLDSGKSELIRELSQLRRIPATPWPEPVESALVLPIGSADQGRPVGCLIAGLSPRRQLDPEYQDFLRLVAGHVATAVAETRAYEAEKARAETLAELDRAKTVFFSNVSHEFRTPLTLMLGPLEDLLAKGGADDDLQLVHRNGLRLLRLVNGLLDFSRIEAGRIQASYGPVDLAELTRELASSFRSACERAGLRLAVDCRPLREPVYVDRDMWEKIVLNLLSNAFKFTLEGEIEVKLEEARGRAQLTVRDTGAGIPAAELPRMFERFHRVRQTHGRTHEGTGIGLALVQELARLHGGEVRVESVLGEGSRFTVNLPFGAAHLDAAHVHEAPGTASNATGPAPFVEEALRWLPGADPLLESLQDRTLVEPPAAPRGERPRIVWADDNADMRDYVRRLLSARYEVEAVGDGEAALAALRARPASLVLADVMMPKLDGLGLLRALRADPQTRTIPAILLSARAGEESRIEGLDAGADDYLQKPFSARELLARVAARLELGQLQARLQQERTHLARLFAQTPVPTAVLRGPHLVFEMANPAYAEVIGGRPLVGKPLLEALPELRGQGFEELLHGVMRSGEAHVGVETLVRLERNGGMQDVYFNFIYAPLRSGGDQVDGAIVIAIDVTEQVVARKQLEKLAEALKQADRRKDEFMAMLAHELRNPLAAIAMGGELLSRTRLEDARARFAVPAIGRQVRQLKRLADDLLDVARATYGKLTLQRAPLELLALAKSVVSEYAIHSSAKARIELAGAEAWVMADATRVRQMLENLLDNALKYGGRTIRVRIGPEGGQGRVSVEDDGQGVDPAELPDLLKPFVQGAQSLDRAEGGLGLGLALVNQLAALHGGRVEAHSDGPGKGSLFAFRLPSCARPEQPEAQAAPGPRSRRVLIVEDEDDTRESLRLMLETDGHEVALARSGNDGLAKLGSFRPHVALVDIGIPGIDGYELARRARTLPGGGSIKLIAMTGYGQDEDRERSAGAGFDLHFTKPVAYEDLVRAFGRGERLSTPAGGS